jgi:hypothetical protein
MDPPYPVTIGRIIKLSNTLQELVELHEYSTNACQTASAVAMVPPSLGWRVGHHDMANGSPESSAPADAPTPAKLPRSTGAYSATRDAFLDARLRVAPCRTG